MVIGAARLDDQEREIPLRMVTLRGNRLTFTLEYPINVTYTCEIIDNHLQGAGAATRGRAANLEIRARRQLNPPAGTFPGEVVH